MSTSQTEKRGTKAVVIALCITILFMFVQLIGGWIANSLALMADAVHMATDVAGFCLTLFAFWMARRPATSKMSYGYYRAEILGAVTSVVILWVICVFLIFEAVRRIMAPPEVHGGIVFIIACITLVMNLITMKVLHGSSKESLNVKAAYLHVISDLIGNIGVIIAGGIIYLTGWYLADPILTILFTCLILVSTLRTLKEAVEILMEATPRHIDADEVALALSKLPTVEEVHDLHIWTVSSGRYALSVHLIATDEAVLEAAHQEMKEKFKIEHMTVQIEHPDQFESKWCFDAT